MCIETSGTPTRVCRFARTCMTPSCQHALVTHTHAHAHRHTHTHTCTHTDTRALPPVHSPIHYLMCNVRLLCNAFAVQCGGAEPWPAQRAIHTQKILHTQTHTHTHTQTHTYAPVVQQCGGAEHRLAKRATHTHKLTHTQTHTHRDTDSLKLTHIHTHTRMHLLCSNAVVQSIGWQNVHHIHTKSHTHRHTDTQKLTHTRTHVCTCCAAMRWCRA